MYGTDCKYVAVLGIAKSTSDPERLLYSATELVMDAIQQTKVNLSVYIGIYISEDDTVYQRQRDETK